MWRWRYHAKGSLPHSSRLLCRGDLTNYALWDFQILLSHTWNILGKNMRSNLCFRHTAHLSGHIMWEYILFILAQPWSWDWEEKNIKVEVDKKTPTPLAFNLFYCCKLSSSKYETPNVEFGNTIKKWTMIHEGVSCIPWFWNLLLPPENRALEKWQKRFDHEDSFTFKFSVWQGTAIIVAMMIARGH